MRMVNFRYFLPTPSYLPARVDQKKRKKEILRTGMGTECIYQEDKGRRILRREGEFGHPQLRRFSGNEQLEALD